MKRLHTCLGVALVIGVLAAGDLAQAANYYVAKTGNNSNPGTEALPFLSLNYGVTRITAGDTLWVKAGVYNESLIYNVPPGTSWTNKVRIAAFTGDTVTMQPTSGNFVLAFAGTSSGGNVGEQKFIEIDGINLDGSHGISFEAVKIEAGPGFNAHHIRLQNLTVTGTPNPPFDTQHPGSTNTILLTGLRTDAIGFNEFLNLTVTGGPVTQDVGSDFSSMFYIQTPDNLIDGCTIHHGIGTGVQIYNGNSPGSMPDRTIIRNTVIRDFVRSPATRQYGIIAARGTGHQIYNNLIYNITATGGNSGGIYLYNTTNAAVSNNTVTGNALFGLLVESGVTGSVLRNNISYGNATDYTDRGTGTVQDHNLLSVNPLFVSASAGNFRLQASSPAVNTGAALVAQDLSGTVRPQGSASDIGAYEFKAASTLPAAPTGLHVVAN